MEEHVKYLRFQKSSSKVPSSFSVKASAVTTVFDGIQVVVKNDTQNMIKSRN